MTIYNSSKYIDQSGMEAKLYLFNGAYKEGDEKSPISIIYKSTILSLVGSVLMICITHSYSFKESGKGKSRLVNISLVQCLQKHIKPFFYGEHLMCSFNLPKIYICGNIGIVEVRKMAKSYEFYKNEVASYLFDRFHSKCKVLDVGAGEGTYYNYLGDYFKKMDAVEVFKPNIDNYKLEMKYNKVYNVDIKDFKYDFYDIIIFGDIIEHLEVKEAQEVLKYAYSHCREMIVAVPYMYEQGIEEDNVYEIHKQPDLTHENMLERYPMLKLLYKNDVYGYYIKGKYGKN